MPTMSPFTAFPQFLDMLAPPARKPPLMMTCPECLGNSNVIGCPLCYGEGEVEAICQVCCEDAAEMVRFPGDIAPAPYCAGCRDEIMVDETDDFDSAQADAIRAIVADYDSELQTRAMLAAVLPEVRS